MSGKIPAVALVNVVLDGDYQYEQEIPLGLAAIGAFLREHKYNVTYKQCFASKGEEQFDTTAQLNADVFGVQLNITNYLYVLKFIERLKEAKPNAIVVLGGPFLASLSEKIMEQEPLYDFIIIGEGEYTFLELLQAIEAKNTDYKTIDGLVWRDSEGKIHKNQYRKLIENLDELPFMARDFFENARKDPTDHAMMESVRIITSRGCVGRCSFCCVNYYNKVQHGKVWRGRSPKNVVDEIETLSKKFGAKIFNFSDSSFEDPGELGKARSREICEEIIHRKIPFSAKIYMRCETMKTEKDTELLRLYKKAGIDVIIIGVESGSDYELKLFEKAASLEDNYRMAKTLNELDLFYVLLGFIMFGPYSTYDTLNNNINFLFQNGFAGNINSIANILILFRDSKLYQILKEEGRVIESENFWELPKYTITDKKVERVAKNWQNIYNNYPASFEVYKHQVEMANVISRMTNPMNSRILDSMYNQYVDFKKKQTELSDTLAQLNYMYFNKVLEMVSLNCSDIDLEREKDNIFNKTYIKYYEVYKNAYDSFLNEVEKRGFGLSGLVFRHFAAALVSGDTKRIQV